MEIYISARSQVQPSSRSVVFSDKKGNIVSVAQKEFTHIFRSPGWVEHDPFGNMVFPGE